MPTITNGVSLPNASKYESLYARYKGENGLHGLKSGKVYKIEKYSYFTRPNLFARMFGKKPELLLISTYRYCGGLMRETKLDFFTEERFSQIWHVESNSYFANLKPVYAN